jgi:hypothetical protein
VYLENTRHKIEATLSDKKAFNEKSAAPFEETELDFKEALDTMEESGLVGRTAEGRFL